MRRFFSTLLMATLVPLAAQGQTATPACTADDFAKTVDGVGATLRTFNGEAAPRLQARLKVLKDKNGWGDDDYEDKAIVSLQDQRLETLDGTANELLARIDTLGRVDAGQPADCTRLEELKTVGIELLAVMKAKSAYLVAKIDQQTGAPAAATAPVPPPVVALRDTLPPPPPVSPPPSKPAATSQQPVPAKPQETWTTRIKPAPVAPSTSGPGPVDVAIAPPPDVGMPLPSSAPTDDGYSIEEIRDATRGFFGAVSTNLATVIEHAFARSGRPTGYILGQEGGGAFLGGLRYGEGTLYVRTGGSQMIYWHGPSVGFDFGAAGARTLFLVYKMRQPADLYRVFTGLDGSAFVVGGVGVTLLGGGNMVLAPIRSGLGVRVGANIGYLRLTERPTWNPF
jgi:hypothetical protein